MKNLSTQQQQAIKLIDEFEEQTRQPFLTIVSELNLMKDESGLLELFRGLMIFLTPLQEIVGRLSDNDPFKEDADKPHIKYPAVGVYSPQTIGCFIGFLNGLLGLMKGFSATLATYGGINPPKQPVVEEAVENIEEAIKLLTNAVSTIATLLPDPTKTPPDVLNKPV